MNVDAIYNLVDGFLDEDEDNILDDDFHGEFDEA